MIYIVKVYDLKKIEKTEWFPEFIKGMKNRMLTSYFKYGPIKDNFGKDKNIDAIKCAKERIKLYEETKNTEYLMDAANFLGIEFKLPSHSNVKFEGTDSDKSPGRITKDGIRENITKK